MTIAVTGPRNLSTTEITEAIEILESLTHQHLLVGDSTGLDQLARQLFKEKTIFKISHDLPPRARYAERSARMVRAIADHNGTLHAFPNTPAPEKLRPSKSWPKNANGSGTWGTIAMAIGNNIDIQIHQLCEFDLPEWSGNYWIV